jgi:hypothetical protein
MKTMAKSEAIAVRLQKIHYLPAGALEVMMRSSVAEALQALSAPSTTKFGFKRGDQ